MRIFRLLLMAYLKLLEIQSRSGFYSSRLRGAGWLDGRGGRDRAIERKCTGAADHEERSDGEDQQVILESLALLTTGPIHEKADGAVHRRYGDEHVDGNAEGSDAREEAEDQTQSAEELGRNGQEREHGRNMRRAGEITHGAGEPVSAEPAQHLLCAVSEEHDSEHEPQNDRCRVVVCGEQSANHEQSPFGPTLEPPWRPPHGRK